MATGWQCPVCGKGVAPGVETCDHETQQFIHQPRFMPKPVRMPYFRLGTADDGNGDLILNATCVGRAN